MSDLLLKIVNMSITASWLILAVIIARLLLKKAPKWLSCSLWALVGIRLIFPISFKSIFSAVPSKETIPSEIATSPNPVINSGIEVIDNAVNPVISETFAPAPAASANPLQTLLPALAVIWLAGLSAMIIHALISYIKLRKDVSASICIGDNIMASDEVKSPFILGLFKPLIYVPSSMSPESMEYVIAHEKTHLKRLDHLWKPLGYLLLSVYWFNPLCWAAYILLCRDIEMACDEKVIKDTDRAYAASYSQALLDCGLPRKHISTCPLAFGEVAVKDRIKDVLNYKKPSFWIIVIALLLCIALAAAFMTNPSKPLLKVITASGSGENAVENYQVIYEEEKARKTKVFASDSFIYYHFGPENFSMAESGSNYPTKLVDTLAIGPGGLRISPPSTAEALIHRLIEETDHVISSATVIDDDGHYFAFVKLDANIQNTCVLYAYDADADTIKKLYEWGNVSFVGLSIPENKTGNDMLINMEQEPKTADDVIRFIALKGGNTLDFDYFNYLQHRNIFETSSCVREYDLSGGDSLYISGADFLTPQNINIVKADGTRLRVYNSAPSENSENQDHQIGIRTLDGDLKFSSVYINTMAQGCSTHYIKDEASVEAVSSIYRHYIKKAVSGFESGEIRYFVIYNMLDGNRIDLAFCPDAENDKYYMEILTLQKTLASGVYYRPVNRSQIKVAVIEKEDYDVIVALAESFKRYELLSTMSLDEVAKLAEAHNYDESCLDILCGWDIAGYRADWGDPIGKTSGTRGDIWYLNDSKDKTITLYYGTGESARGPVYNVSIENVAD